MKNRSPLLLLASQVWKNIVFQPGSKVLILFMNGLLIGFLIVGLLDLNEHQRQIHGFGEEVREKWENSPDKHPHRMAHYGYLVFREKFPLSYFDFGMDSYLGNVIFLEAHRQNTANFSEANLSNGLLRFGEISAGMILQILVPLLIFFWGYDLITRDRENGTLKILFSQGVEGLELVWGRVFGLFWVSLSLVGLPLLLGFAFLFLQPENELLRQSLIQYLVMTLAYLAYFLILSLVAVLVSAKSQSSKSSLTALIGFWLLFTLVLPKVSQVVGQSVFSNPSKIEFDSAVEEEIIQQGDSHNPNDPHYASLKDSLLQAHQVDSVHKLPFNYSGFVMREGERLSTETYLRHEEALLEIFQNQQKVIRIAAWADPFLAIKLSSMGLSGTDEAMYQYFKAQSEAYRYELAQTMNNLQIDLISNQIKSSSDPSARLTQDHWKGLPDFHQQFLSLGQVLSNQLSALFILGLWLLAGVLLSVFYSKRIKVV
ncbi:DUF3526 domain-containing protein [Algoriphagus aestuariicola]|uniref:DUF3526 domain-containing protein n=1 Tax=Algoriphagus aestuariicola TaxID=1852016 RepID=A0ABS3BTF1_9BACT|nr:DUF3526 domain-containing protein [Algoriphagus aestuariicola]MBN7801546.1 DUF3526 domain-containing protein [Algoriphagus aestuariicola]